jgi:hypothetical protein
MVNEWRLPMQKALKSFIAGLKTGFDIGSAFAVLVGLPPQAFVIAIAVILTLILKPTSIILFLVTYGVINLIIISTYMFNDIKGGQDDD